MSLKTFILGTSNWTRADLRDDLQASLAVTAIGIPQGIAYALIAGLPPSAGLYASCVPTIVGTLFRSSRHVVTGPTNALSLLVGGAVVAQSPDPVGTALTLALLIGAIQTLAGVLRLGVLVDYISNPVVVGYITGAGVLIGVGQLPNLTGTEGATGTLVHKLVGWAAGLSEISWGALIIGGLVAIGILALRKINRSIPAVLLLLTVATALSWAFDLQSHGIGILADLSPVPQGMPPLTLPSMDWETVSGLLPIAVAGTVLSLVESSSVARAISIRTGQRLDLDREFLGQGLANLAAAFTGGYPTSGSLSRSALNHQVGAKSKLGGVFSGVLMLVALLFLGPIVNYTPISALAGMLLIVAMDLVDTERIATLWRTSAGDATAFTVTVIGTWALSLDQAIYLGVLVSIVLFLRRVRHLVVTPLGLGDRGRLREASLERAQATCRSIRIIHVEGQMFFAAATELENALVEAAEDPEIEVLIVRLKRTQGMDVTTAEVLASFGARMAEDERHLFLVGMRPGTLNVLQKAGVDRRLGRDHLYPTRRTWFAAMDEAIRDALVVVGAHGEGPCPLEHYLANRSHRPAPEREESQSEAV